MFNISFIFNMSNYLLQNLWSINNVKKGHDQLIRKQKQKICEKLFFTTFYNWKLWKADSTSTALNVANKMMQSLKTRIFKIFKYRDWPDKYHMQLWLLKFSWQFKFDVKFSLTLKWGIISEKYLEVELPDSFTYLFKIEVCSGFNQTFT